jgi:hypothetical protein
MSDKPSPAEKELAEIMKATPGVMEFNPEHIYYSSEKATYFVDTGEFYRVYTRKMPVKNGMRRYLESQGKDDGEIKDLINDYVETIEIDRAIDWNGKLAGYKRGVAIFGGRKFLITDGYDLPESKEGDCPLHLNIIAQAFKDPDAQAVFCGWLQGSVNAIRASEHQPAPMLVLAGEKGAGKSLLAHICKQAMGGRSSNPMTAWAGTLPWNDNLLGAELLLIDDSVSSTDIRARKAFGARFKEAIYAGSVEINTRQKSSISIRPVWRVMICCNETAENLSVIPPLEEGIEDKVILMKVAAVKMPMLAETPEPRIAFQKALADELPAFLAWLESVEIPEHLGDTRSSVTAWKDAELLEAVLEISPEKRLEKLIALAITKNHMNDGWQCAQEVQSQLLHYDSPTASQARTLLKYDNNAGTYLSRLKDQGSAYVGDKRRNSDGIYQYLINNPSLTA